MVKQGRILKGIGGFYYVEAEETIYECKARGVFRKRGTTPLAGDWVQICIDNDTGTIEEIFPRKNMLVRPPCANIDQMFLVTSICNPSPNLLVLDKMIAVAEDQEMEPILVISKTDLQSADELEQIYQKAGIQVITVSSVSGQGIAQIKMLLKDKISSQVIRESENHHCSIVSVLNFGRKQESSVQSWAEENIRRGR